VVQDKKLELRERSVELDENCSYEKNIPTVFVLDENLIVERGEVISETVFKTNWFLGSFCEFIDALFDLSVSIS